MSSKAKTLLRRILSEITNTRGRKAARRRRSFRHLGTERLELRQMLAGDYAVVDTGQALFYDDTGEIIAPVQGEAFYGQDAQFAGNQPSYTTSADGLTVLDNVTGLTWTQGADWNDDGTLDVDDKFTYANAQTYIDTLNAGNYGGFSDWRVPTIKELYSLIDFRGIDPNATSTDPTGLVPFIDDSVFQFAYGDTAAGQRIIDSQWITSTFYVSTIMNGNTGMFGVNFADGRIKGYPADGSRYARFVRGNTDYGENQFADNGDGTITDNATELMWSQSDSGAGLNWEDALAWVQQKNDEDYLGHNDWRLPNAKELQSLLDYTRSPDTHGTAAIDPLFHATAITVEDGSTDYPFYWSGTTHASGRGGQAAVYVSFGQALGNMNGNWLDVHGAGAQRSDPKDGDPANYPTGRGPQGDAIRIFNYVRLVRDADTPSPNVPPTAEAGGPYTTVLGVDAAVDGSASTDNDGSLSAFAWDLDNDGQYDDATGATATFTAATIGVFTVGLQVTDDDGATDTDTATITVFENGPPVVTIEATDPNAAEEGPDTGTFTISRTGVTDGNLTVQLTLRGSATEGDDYLTLATAAVIPDGQSSVAVTVTPVDDELLEPTERVRLSIAADAAYTVGAADAATVRITDNDASDIVLGKPTDQSITVNVIPHYTGELYFEYGTASGLYTDQTSTLSGTADEVLETVIGGLSANTEYFYRMVYRTPGGAWNYDTEYSFNTQRDKGETFVFTITSDSHYQFNRVHRQAMQNVLADDPDFHFDLGDTFLADDATSQSEVDANYLDYRAEEYFGAIGDSVPIFLAPGNHENEEGWHLDDTPFSAGVASIQARKLYYPTPIDEGEGGFYTGNTDPLANIDESVYGDEFREDYYAFEWGDALFVVIDPFQYTTSRALQTEDQWDWTLGYEQYTWLTDVLATSDSQYKFVFSHHMAGGIPGAAYVRGGAGGASYFEWGGQNEDGSWGFSTERPGWGVTADRPEGSPIHQLFIDHGVNAFFHGHDHEYAYESLDGIVYQSLPGFLPGFDIYDEADPYTHDVLPGTGHLRVMVTSTEATVDYVRSDETGISHSYTIETNDVPTADAGGPYSGTVGDTIALSGTGSSDTDGTVAAYAWDLDNDGQYDDASGVTVNFAATAAGSFTIGLRVTDDDGATDPDSATITVAEPPNVAPTADAGGPYSGTVGDTIALSGTGSSDTDGTIDAYAWDLDNDGQYDDASGATVNFAATAAGSFTIGLRVTDDDGATDTDTATITVAEPPNVAPTAHAGGPYSGTVGDTIALSGTSSTDTDGTIDAYAWDLDNDGQYDDASGATVNFAATAAGSFTIGLRVTDDDGATDTDSATVTVSSNQPPEVVSPISDQTVRANRRFRLALATDTFVDPDVGQSLTYAATLADGSPLPGWLAFDSQKMTFTGRPLVRDVGQYDIRVTATDSGSPALSATTEFTIDVKSPPLRRQNADLPPDVDGNDLVTPVDVLNVINWINGYGSGPVADVSPVTEGGSFLFVDVNGDNLASAIDVLLVINFINSDLSSGALDGEGEGLSLAGDLYAISDAASAIQAAEIEEIAGTGEVYVVSNSATVLQPAEGDAVTAGCSSAAASLTQRPVCDLPNTARDQVFQQYTNLQEPDVEDEVLDLLAYDAQCDEGGPQLADLGVTR